MIKPNSLRAAIVAAMPDLEREPERLAISIEKGKTFATGRRLTGDAVAAFEYRYTLVLTALDFAGDPDLLFTVILVWAAQHQRELLDAYPKGTDGVGFELDVLDENKVDLEIRLPLTEAVGVTRTGQALDFTHFPEPPDAEHAVNAALGLPAAPSDAPAFAGVVIDGTMLQP